jgi:hypothetical protein
VRQFNTPPEWPDPPTPDWRPPRRWQPPESWPAAPDRWVFWVDEHGRAVRGPIGRYGGPRRLTSLAIVAVPTALMALVLLNPFSGGDSTDTAPDFLPTRSATAPATPAERGEKPARAERTPTSTTAQIGSSTPAGPPTTTTTATTATTTPTTTPTQVGPRSVPPTTATPKTTRPATPQSPRATPTPATVVYNSCAEVRAAGKAPLHRGDPGYSAALDRNGDGVACERGNS